MLKVQNQSPYIPHNNQLVHPFTRQLSIETRADAQTVRPYIHSNGPECWRY
mgnify:CR=1 FL=1